MKVVRDPGAWILLRGKLPTEVSPPKLSIHYSLLWRMSADVIRRQWQQVFVHASGAISVGKMAADLAGAGDAIFREDGLTEDNAALSRAIVWNGEKIRVWAREYSIVQPSRWPVYYPEAFEFVPDPRLSELYMLFPSKGDKSVYDAALLDGCTDYQALQTVLGREVDESPAPVGWFRIKPEYGRMFASEDELAIVA